MTGKKTRLKINIIDLLILAAIIAAAAFAFYYFMSGAGGNRCVVHFVVEIKDVDEHWADRIKLDDDIKDSIKGFYLGRVEAIEVEPNEVTLFDYNESRFVQTIAEDSYTVNIRIIADGTETEAEIKAGQVPIKVGKLMTIKGKGYAQKGYITDMYVMEKEED